MSDPQQTLEARFAEAIEAAFGAEYAGTDPQVRPAQSAKFGDYQSNAAMPLAKQLGRKPRDVAEAIVERLKWTSFAEQKPEIAGPGFINVTLGRRYLAERAAAMAADEQRLGVEGVERPQTVVIDYSGPNVAKEMHVGHLRSTVIGDAIARILDHLGHRVIRQNHLGDWGTQFGMLIEHLFDAGYRERVMQSVAAAEFYRITRRTLAEATKGVVPKTGVADLNTFYQEAKQKFDQGSHDFAERARLRVSKLQNADPETILAWTWLFRESRTHFNQVYRRLGVELEPKDIRSESFYNGDLANVVRELEQCCMIESSEGAACVFMDEFSDSDGNRTPMIVQKADGGYLYATTDLAALKYRVKKLHADRIIYVTDQRQKQHFAMVFKAAEKAGWTEKRDGTTVRLDHVPFGTILGEDGKPFKTRTGETVRLIDLLDEAERRAESIVREKNPELSKDKRELRRVSHRVGIGAVKYSDLSNDRRKDYIFSWPRMLAMDGNTAPYLQYACTRIRSIFRKAGEDSAGVRRRIETPVIEDEAERVLMLKIAQLGPALRSVGDSLEPHRLCNWLYEVATAFSAFYENCPVLRAEDETRRDSRLLLCDLAARSLEQGLGLLGIEVPKERM